MSGTSCVFYRGFQITAGGGEDSVAPWDPYADLRFRFVVTVKAPNQERARFSYWSSVVDFVEGRDRLDDVRLRWAFRSWVEDAKLGALDFRSFRDEYALGRPADGSGCGLAEVIPHVCLLQVYRICRSAYLSCLRLEVPIEDPEFIRDLDADAQHDLIDAVQAVVLRKELAKGHLGVRA